MRTFIRGTSFIIAASLLGGCSSSSGTKSASTADVPMQQMADSQTCTLTSGGTGVLKLTTPPATTCQASDGMLRLIGKDETQFEVWFVPGAKSVDEALPQVGKQIVSEFTDFKPGQPTDLTVAGSPAKKLIGKGHEADDGDPGSAEVIVFKLGQHVFVACYHGEGLTPGREQRFMTMVQSVQMP